jgi:hypothetical protein
VIADDQLDDEVEAITSRLMRFDHDAIARTKSYVDQVMLPADGEISSSFDDARETLRVPNSRRIGPDSRRSGSTPTATSNGLSVGAWSRGLSRPELC